MTFAAYETADGSPIELITFKNGALTFRYANTVSPVVFGVNTFQPLAYQRSKFAQSKDSDDNNIRMTVAKDMEIVQLFNGILTSFISTVTIERFHQDDPDLGLQVAWQGRVVAVNHKSLKVELLLQPITHGAESTPRDVFSSLCNAFLFQTPGCKLLRTDWKFDATVTSLEVTNDIITFNGLRARAAALDAALAAPAGPLTSGELDTYWQGGYIEMVNGEKRDIVEGNYGGDPDAVRVDIPFRSIAVTDAATVYAGCNLLRSTCNKKFNNVLNFQGYPDIPEVDPANSELPPGSRTSVNTFAGPGS